MDPPQPTPERTYVLLNARGHIIKEVRANYSGTAKWKARNYLDKQKLEGTFTVMLKKRWRERQHQAKGESQVTESAKPSKHQYSMVRKETGEVYMDLYASSVNEAARLAVQVCKNKGMPQDAYTVKRKRSQDAEEPGTPHPQGGDAMPTAAPKPDEEELNINLTGPDAPRGGSWQQAEMDKVGGYVQQHYRDVSRFFREVNEQGLTAAVGAHAGSLWEWLRRADEALSEAESKERKGGTLTWNPAIVRGIVHQVEHALLASTAMTVAKFRRKD